LLETLLENAEKLLPNELDRNKVAVAATSGKRLTVEKYLGGIVK